jgi:hypothetical protein
MRIGNQTARAAASSSRVPAALGAEADNSLAMTFSEKYPKLKR